jgi:hypothetical protein
VISLNGLNNLLTSNKFIKLLKSWPTTLMPPIYIYIYIYIYMFPKLPSIIANRQTIETMIDYRKLIMIIMNIFVYLKTIRKKLIICEREWNKHENFTKKEKWTKNTHISTSYKCRHKSVQIFFYGGIVC